MFHSAGLGRDIVRELSSSGANISPYEVANPSDNGTVEISSEGKPISVTENQKCTF